MKHQGPGKKGAFTKHEKTTRLKVLEPAELMNFLMEKMPDRSRNTIKSLLVRGQVAVEGEVVKQYNHLLQVGQEITIDGALVREKAIDKGLDILYEDADILVIDKPAGLLTIASETEKENTAYRLLMDHVRKANPQNRIFIVHRLDRDTSGVMLFAKNENIKNRFQNEWKNIVAERAYVAVVEGNVQKKEGTIKSWLSETKTKLMYSTFKPGEGAEAITHYKVLQTTAYYTLLKLHLETGRKNQIRVHMKDIGHPIVGDKKYGAKTNPIGRLALHAQILAFYHPVTNKLMHFEIEIPPSFLRLFQ